MPDEGAARPTLEAFHLPVTAGQRFCMLHAPASAPMHDDRGRAIVYVHPFCEEMNKSRRMAALQASALAVSGWTVLQIDLEGCGDSDDDFADASWEGWVADVIEAARWLRDRSGCAPWLWGLRAGCLLAVEAARRLGEVAGMLFWQPVISGQQHLRQFLRLRLAAEALGLHEAGTGAARSSTDTLREQLLAGSAAEVAGYTLAPAVAIGLDAARLGPIRPAATCPLVWLEITGGATPTLAPASRPEIERWRTAGHAVDARAVTGPAFWQTQEIEESLELLRETLAALASIET